MRAQPALRRAHAAAILRVVVIVAQQVQQAVEREDLQLGPLGVPRLARLPPRDAARDHDVAEIADPGLAGSDATMADGKVSTSVA